MDFMPESTAVTSMFETPSSSYTDGNCMLTYHKTIHSPTISLSSSEEEEDMANCLIMLAHSVSPAKEDRSSNICCQSQRTEIKLKTRSVTEMTGTTGTNPGFQTYECKTCNRTFPSFQALGGHRASHKKPKLTVDEKNTRSDKLEYSEESQPKLVVVHEQNKTVANKYSPSVTPDHSIHTGYKNSQTKVHQCSICGSEFLSGQALGGHMRRHRAAPPPMIVPMKQEPSPEKSRMMSLDLNLPPPEIVDDGFQFTASSSQQPQPLVFSAAALVDCHY